MNQPSKQTLRRPSSPFTLAAGALAVSLLLAACGGGDPVVPPDSTPPTVAITDNTAGTATGAVTFTFTFSEDVGSSFLVEDVLVTGGTAGAFTKVSGTVFTLVVTPPANATGDITVSVAAAKFKDLANNDNTVGASGSQAFDTVAASSTGTVVANFDTVVPGIRDTGDTGGFASISTSPPAGGGSGSALAVLRNGVTNYALSVLDATVPFTATRKTLSARVYSPTAGIPMKMKLEGAGGAVLNDLDANETVVVGWQTLTWTFSPDLTKTYNAIVLLPNIGAIDASPGKTYYFDDITLLPEVVAPPPTTTGTVVANFDTVVPGVRDTGDTGGFASISTSPPAGGGSGSALAVLRNGVTNYALSVLDATVPFTATRKTLSARVYSPTAGIPMKMKLEGAGGAVLNDLDANEAVVVGWQTLTWTFSPDLTKTYNAIVLLPNIGAIDASPGKTYYFDDITLLPEVAPPPTTTDTVVADFDTVVPGVRDTGDTGGFASISTSPPAGGGSGSALAVLRNGVTNYALSVLDATVPFTATRKTLSARVYSPTAGIPMKMKLEGAGGAVLNDLDANETVVVGWQTLTWTFSPDLTKTYNAIVLLPNIGAIDASPGKTYYFDDIKLLAAASGGGGTTTPGVEMGAGGPQTLTIATGDVKTGDGGNTMFVAGEGLFMVNVVGSAEAFAPFNLAAWPNAKTANFAGITGIAGGDIGYFQDDVNLSNSTQKVDEGGWVAGTALSPNGVPSFFRYFVLKGPVSNSAYMGLYANAPNNGTVNVSSFGKIKLKVWGPGPMFERTNFDPVLEVTLTGPKVAGCPTGSGGSEITQNLTANLKNGAGGFYTMPLSGFTVKGLCGTDTGAANVLANLARVVVTVPGTSFNYTNLDGGNYATGVNLGPVGFTNN